MTARSEQWSWVSLREHLEEIIKLRFNAMDAAVKLAAAMETERHKERWSELAAHLKELNNSHEKAREKEADFVPRDTLRLQLEKIDERIKSLERVAAAAIALAAALPLLLKYFVKP